LAGQIDNLSRDGGKRLDKPMNFAAEVVDAAPANDRALLELARDGSRREWSFGDVSTAAAALAGQLARRGVGRGDVVMTLVGNRPEWVLTMVACFRLGAVVLPCTEQLRAKDLRLRMDVAEPRLIVADERNRAELEAAAPEAPILYVPDPALLTGAPAPAADLRPEDPCLMTFTSGTTGAPKAVVHGQRYLAGQRVQADGWLGGMPGDLVWCTASSGWSKSARNAFIAPWLRGAAALLHDARFDPEERLRLVRDEGVAVLCMAPTEYRVIANRAEIGPLPGLRGLVAAGEALTPDVVGVWAEASGVWIRDGYGQTETGQITGFAPGEEVRLGSMGRPLPGIGAEVVEGELVLDAATVPTFFLGYLGEPPIDRSLPWHTGDRVFEDADGYLHFEGRNDDIIVSSGYRIGPSEVESALTSHPAVADAAAVAAPDPERGQVVRALVVLGDEAEPSDELAQALKDHVKAQTAPYKYPRIVEFVPSLPRTTSGKIQRALLR
jgi:acyl-coenzyme A synthetase/AMP-(fatty) acid ligase